MELPYDPSSMKWNDAHNKNEEDKYCYCGSGWRRTEFAAHCNGCKNWFHASCMDSPPTPIIPYVLNYKFTCKICGKGTENFERTDGNFKAALIATIANLNLETTEESEGICQKFHDVKADITPFVDKHWGVLWGRQKAKSQKWATTLVSTMTRNSDLFKSKSEAGVQRFNLKDQSPYKLTPLITGNSKRKSEEVSSSLRRTKRMTKEKESSGDSSAAAPNSNATHPYNKDGYMYTLAEEDPYTPNAYRHARSDPGVCLSQHDRAPQLKLSEDRSVITGDKGYCMARASHGVTYGTWFYEAEILESTPLADLPAGHTRIGWASKHGHLQGPCGYDCFSYSWRDIEGTKFHLSRGQPYGESYGAGDTLGFLIDIPQKSVEALLPMRTQEEKPIIYKGNVYFEEKLAVDKSKVTQIKGSKIIAYKNGVCQGVMFEDLNEGAYFPAVSLYMNAQVRVNFGPNFKYPPKDIKFQPMEEAVFHHNALITLADLVGKVDFGIQDLEKNLAKEEAAK